MAIASQMSLQTLQPHGFNVKSAEERLSKQLESSCSFSNKCTSLFGQSVKRFGELDSRPQQQKNVKKPVVSPVWSFVETSETEEMIQSFTWTPQSIGTPMMNKKLSSTPGVTIEKTKMDLSVERPKVAAKLEMGGGGRGNDNKNANGGGDGGDDGGDDDDYLGGDGEDDGDDDNGFIRKLTIVELFDRETIEAVLQEWYKSIKDLPSGFRRAVELGLMSSAQLVRFIAIDARPTIARTLSRLAPSDLSREFIGRMIADPGFVFKIGLEQAITIGSAVHWEVKQRGDKLKNEWDLALVNVLTLCVCNAALTWAVSPSRSYGSTARFDWQNLIQKLPNHMFDKSYPLREFSLQKRFASLFYKATELSLLGTVTGAVAGSLSNALVDVRRKRNPKYRPSVPVPSTSTNAVAHGAFLGLSGNLRYQLVYGVDRYLYQNMNSLTLAVLVTSGLRYFNQQLGEPSRLAWLGLDKSTVTLAQNQAQAYRRPSESKTSKLLPFNLPTSAGTPKDGSADTKAAVRRARRKVKRKVSMAQ